MKQIWSKIANIFMCIVVIICVYLILCQLFYGNIIELDMGHNENKQLLYTENLAEMARDYVLSDNGDYVSTSTNACFIIEESFDVKTIVIDISKLGYDQGKAQVYFYSDEQALSKNNSQIWKLKKGINYIQIPKGHYNKFQLHLVSAESVNFGINSIALYGSRVYETLFWVLEIIFSILIIKWKKVYALLCKYISAIIKKFFDINGYSDKSNKDKIKILLFYILCIVVLIFGAASFENAKRDVLKIVAMPEKNILSEDFGVGILDIYLDNQRIDFSKIQLSEGWILNSDNILVAYNANKELPLYIDISNANRCTIKYIKRNLLGKMRIENGNDTILIDSYENTDWNEEIVTVEKKIGYYKEFLYLEVIGLFALVIYALLLKETHKLMIFLQAYCATLSLALSIYGHTYLINKSIIILCLIFICLIGLFNYASKFIINNKINIILMFIVSAFFAINSIVYDVYRCSNSLKIISANYIMFVNTLIRIIGYNYLYLSLLKIFILFICKIKWGSIQNINNINNKRRLFLGSLCIIISWILTIIIFFPGTIMWDSYAQLNYYFGLWKWSNHHPALVTAIMGICMQIGRFVFESDNIGVFLYIVFQTIITWLVMIKMLNLILKLSCNRIMYWITVAYFSIFSVWSAYIQCEIKDTLFFAFILLYVICLIELINEPVYFMHKRLNMYIMVASIILMCLYRNNGIYVFLLSFPFLICVLRNYRKKMLLIMGGIILLYSCFTKILLPEVGIIEGSKAEMLSIPFQQTARYVKLYPDLVSDEERDVIDSILEYDELATRYNPIKSDPVKETYKGGNLSLEEEKEILKNYFKVWIKEFCKKPFTYIEATLLNSYGYFSPQYLGYEYGFYLYETNEVVNTGYFNASYNSNFQNVRQIYIELIDWLRTVPIVKWLYSCGTYSWIIIFLILIILLQKNYKKLIPFIPILAVMIICIASPVNAYIRYYLPVMATVPILTVWVLHTNKEDIRDGQDSSFNTML